MKLQAAINHESQLRQQKELFGNLERKITDLAMKMQGNHDKLFDIIRAETQVQVQAITPAIDDKIVIMNGIKEKFEEHEQILNKIIDNQNATQELIKANDLEDHTQFLKNIISDSLVDLQEIDDKLKTIEDNTIPKIEQLKFYQGIQQQLSKNLN